MNNTIATSYSGLVTQACQAAAGITLHGTALGLTFVTDAAITAKVTAYIMGENNSIQEKNTLSTRRAALRSTAQTAYTYLLGARDVLKQSISRQYSPAWNETGFVGKLVVPTKEAKMVQLLQALIAYFTAHPEKENAALNITAARGTAVLDALIDARYAVNGQLTTARTAIEARKEKADEIRGMLKNLLKDLSLRMGPLDARWLAFGFNTPGVLSVPEIPANVIAVLVGPSSAALKWDRAVRAERYRIYKKVVGVDTEMVLVETREDLDFVLEGLPSGKTIQIAVAAVNSGGASQMSQTVSIVTP